jgi:hypothetical protein
MGGYAIRECSEPMQISRGTQGDDMAQSAELYGSLQPGVCLAGRINGEIGFAGEKVAAVSQFRHHR